MLICSVDLGVAVVDILESADVSHVAGILGGRGVPVRGAREELSFFEVLSTQLIPKFGAIPLRKRQTWSK